ncbi:MAG: ribosomal RNA small subunit methyltransferase A [Ruminococcaceae bacterium]|nr:ribosomal RNA small subunit methyltransferase A [Oscillospiraceae bacterium]
MYLDLCSPRTIKELLDRYGLAPKKGYGQNFLTNPMVPEAIADAAADASGECKAVLEIGPGLGVLTRELGERFSSVVAVEIDRGLIPLLEETLGEYENVRVINEDFMETELTELLHENFGDARPAVCANLPYYITTPIIMKLLEDCPYSCGLPYTSITVMVQFEVADRIAAKQGSADYGAITAAVGLRCSVKKVLTVSPGSFYPPPKVTSAVIQLVPHEKGIYSVYENAPEDREECESFGRRVSELVGAAFSMRRKTLVNALASVYPKEKTLTALESLGMRADIRGERLSSRDFCALADILEKI